MIVLAKYDSGRFILTPWAFPDLEKAREFADKQKLAIPTKFVFVDLVQQVQMRAAA